MPRSKDDLDGFFDEFAVDALYNGRIVPVIFDNEYEGVSPQDGEVESAGPQGTVKDSDINGIKHGDTMRIDLINYKIRGIQPDGTGLTVLILSKD